MKAIRFINHPRWGKVYPIITKDTSTDYIKYGRASTVGLTSANMVILHSTVIRATLEANLAAFVCHPFFLIPSLLLNYCMMQYNYSYFKASKNILTNMFLKPNGKEIIYECRDGSHKTIPSSDIYEPVFLNTKWESSVTFGHGANHYIHIRGNYHIFDLWAL